MEIRIFGWKLSEIFNSFDPDQLIWAYHVCLGASKLDIFLTSRKRQINNEWRYGVYKTLGFHQRREPRLLRVEMDRKGSNSQLFVRFPFGTSSKYAHPSLDRSLDPSKLYWFILLNYRVSLKELGRRIEWTPLLRSSSFVRCLAETALLEHTSLWWK